MNPFDEPTDQSKLLDALISDYGEVTSYADATITTSKPMISIAHEQMKMAETLASRATTSRDAELSRTIYESMSRGYEATAKPLPKRKMKSYRIKDFK